MTRMGLFFKQIWLTILLLIIVSIDKYLALTLCPTATWKTTGITVAGSSGGTSGSTATRLRSPTDVYIDNNDVLYVLDSGNYRVQRFRSNSTNGTTVIASSYGGASNQFRRMDKMSINNSGNLYILDGYNARVMQWLPGASSGTVVAGDDDSLLYTYGGMFVDWSTSIVWIADTYNHQIVAWTSPDTSTVVCGSLGSNNDQFQYPYGLYVDTSNANTLYVADTYNHRVQMWVSGGTSGVTVAGITSYYGDTLSQLYCPKTLIVDSNRNMFIVDQYNYRILKWKVGESSGVIIAGGNGQGTQTNQFNSPTNINFDSSGSLYVADMSGNRIQKFVVSCPTVANISTTTVSSVSMTTASSSNINCSMTTWSVNATTTAGSPIGLSGSTSTSLDSPFDAFVDNNNSVYVIDYGNNRVQRFRPGSIVGTTIINSSSGSQLNQVSYMQGISIDLNNNIYILDSGNNRVTKWAPGASTGVLVAGTNGFGPGANQLENPGAIFMVPGSSTIWIADTFNHRIVRWDNQTNGTIVCGSYGSNANQFMYPAGLYVDGSASNTLYVADTNNHRLQMWLPGASNGTTIAGQTGVCGSGLSQLCEPGAVILDTYGFIYISDTRNNRVVRWIIGSASGTVVAGGAGFGVLPSQLNYPYSTKFDLTGALIVVDRVNNRVQKFAVNCGPAASSTTTSMVPSTRSIVPSTASIISSTSVTSTTTKSSSPSTVSTSTVMTNVQTTTRESSVSVVIYPQCLLIILSTVITIINKN